MTRRAGLALPLLLGLAACRTARVSGPAGTALTLTGASRQALADMLARAMLNRGYQVRSLDAEHAVFARPADAVPGAMLVGADRSGTPETRVRFTFADSKSGVDITAKLELVSNPGKRFEHASPPNGSDDLDRVEEALAQVRSRVAAAVAARAAEAAKAAEAETKARKAIQKERTASKPESNDAAARPRAAQEPPPEDETLEQMKKRVMGRP